MTPGLSNTILALEDSPWYCLRLQCKHDVYTTVKLRNEFPTDTHWIWCPPCRKAKKLDYSFKSIPSAWSEVINVKAVTDEHVHDVREWSAFVVSRSILRLQPAGTEPAHPFPYVKAGRLR